MPLFRSHKHLSGSQTPAIIVYPNRRRTTVWLLVGAVSSLLAFLIFIFVLILIIVIPAARNGGAIITAVLMGGGGITAIWPTRVLARVLSSGEPILVITHEGIRVGKLYSSFEIMLPWQEIEAISLFGGGIEKQLFIRPTNVGLFLSHFGLLMRFVLRINLLTGAPIAVAQSLLEKPIEEILDQLVVRYEQELESYNIQLRSPHFR
jgi:hypothetical protein